jgi:hypothetical protein
VMFSVVDPDKQRLMAGYPEEVKKIMQSVLDSLKSGS